MRINGDEDVRPGFINADSVIFLNHLQCLITDPDIVLDIQSVVFLHLNDALHRQNAVPFRLIDVDPFQPDKMMLAGNSGSADEWNVPLIASIGL